MGRSSGERGFTLIEVMIVMIIIGGVGGFISGAIGAIIYNIILGAIGGIEMDLEAKV